MRHLQAIKHNEIPLLNDKNPMQHTKKLKKIKKILKLIPDLLHTKHSLIPIIELQSNLFFS